MEDIRGNVDTRIEKAMDPSGTYDAVLFAHAGLERLGRLEVVTQVLEFDRMLPAPAQGAMAVQCRNEESWVSLIRAINDPQTEMAVTAERAFLAGLGGGCSLPVSALGTIEAGELRLRGRVTSRDGTKQIELVRAARAGGLADAEKLGLELAEEALAGGAADILE